MDEEIKSQAAELHEYLKRKLHHNWRLETWRKKYEARIRGYGLEKCRIAVDGFCSMKWYVENHSQDAPDLIFRSEKQVEKFLALGMKLPEHDEESNKQVWQETSRRTRMAETRTALEQGNVKQTARMQKKLETLKEELTEHSYAAFIKPLLFVEYVQGTVVIFSEDALWIRDHYLVKIERALGVKVKVVNEV